MRKNFITKSYKHKLRASYTTIMFMVLLAIGLFMYIQFAGLAKPLANQSDLHQVDGQARLLGEKLDNQKHALEQLANIETFKSGTMASISREVDNQMNINSNLWIAMKYTDLSGNVYEKKIEDVTVTTAFEKQLVSASSRTLTVQTRIESMSDSKIIIGTKIFDDSGKLRGMLIVNSYLGKLITLIESQSSLDNSNIWILDSNGNVMVALNNKDIQFGKLTEFKSSIANRSSDIITVTAQNGTTNSLIYAKITDSNGLYLAKMVKQTDLTSGLRVIRIFLICSAITACILIFIIANKMTNLMTNPLTRMVEVIEQSNGVNSIVLPKELMESRDEIGILAQTIDTMSKNIRSYVEKLNTEIEDKNRAEDELILLTDELENRVEQRTFELTNAKNSLAVSEDRFRIAMEVSEIGLYDSNCEYSQTVVNGAFLKLINASVYKQSLVKESEWVPFECKFEDYIYEEDMEGFPQIGANNQLIVQNEFSTEFRLKENPEIWLSFVGQAVEEVEGGVVTRFIGVLQNITDRKNYEVELKHAKDEAEEASRAKSQFLANMSHEIRTPMNAIMGLTHLISQSDLNQTQKNYVSKISGASSSLLRIINDILDFSKIEAGKLEVEHIKFNLYKVLENVSNLYTASATSKGIDINFDIDENVPEDLIGDSLRLEQIISNLTTNAIKFTDQGEVNLVVRKEEETDTQVVLKFSVTDTGIGMTSEQIEKLFSAFTQADGSMTRKYGGTGLGLTISKQLVELMDGHIWANSVFGEGSTFHFTIRFKRQLDVEKPDFADYPDLKGRRALVIDHNRTSLTILERMLKSFSLEVTALRDPVEALDLLMKQEFDLLVVDFNLPEVSGIDLYKRVVASSGLRPPKTIFVSATGRESYYSQVNQLGVRNLLVKPINQSLLFDAVISALKDAQGGQMGRAFVGLTQEKHRQVLAGKHVLLVEDNDINQLVARDMLEQAGIVVTIAGNGEEATKLVRSNRFDIVLMDVQMPVMDGYKATELIRKSYSSTALPIIAMTANALKGDREKSIEAGMNDYVSKPINPELLFETIAKWIQVDLSAHGKGMTKKPEAEQATLPATGSELPVLDQQLALTRLSNKQEFLVELLRRYKNHYSELPSELKSLQDRGLQEDARRLIHSLKSVTGNIGAMKLNQFMIAFEGQYDLLSPAEFTERLQQLDLLNRQLLAEIEKIDTLTLEQPRKLGTAPIHESEEATHKHPIDTADVTLFDAVRKLRFALEKARAKEIKECMSLILERSDKEPQKNLQLTNKLEEIRKQVERYRFKDAIHIVDELLKGQEE